jgi:hypothetical protein
MWNGSAGQDGSRKASELKKLSLLKAIAGFLFDDSWGFIQRDLGWNLDGIFPRRSTIHDPRSTIHDPRSTIHYPQSTIHDLRSSQLVMVLSGVSDVYTTTVAIADIQPCTNILIINVHPIKDVNS